jgi:hypothetical protein
MPIPHKAVLGSPETDTRQAFPAVNIATLTSVPRGTNIRSPLIHITTLAASSFAISCML